MGHTSMNLSGATALIESPHLAALAQAGDAAGLEQAIIALGPPAQEFTT